jgi:hypothetical protein
MWLETITNDNPDIFNDIVDTTTVERILDSINLVNDHDARAEIEWELALESCPRIDETRAAAISMYVNVLEEQLNHKKNNFKLKTELKKLQRKVNQSCDCLEAESISQIIFPSLKKSEIEQYIKLSDKIISNIQIINRDYNKYYKELNHEWKNLGWYKKYLDRCSQIYHRISPYPFTISFKKGCQPGDWIVASKASYFLYEFHNIINQMLVKINCEPFTDSNFKTVCTEICREYRKNLSSS